MHTIATSPTRFENKNSVGRMVASFLSGLRRVIELSGAPYANGQLPPL
jgi:hypothetical protein